MPMSAPKAISTSERLGIMVQFNLKKREVSLKIVYYGPALSGKTTNLQALFGQADKDARGRLVTLETRDDRTIYFDMLPVVLPSTSGHRLSFKLYTVPGQPVHNATRRVVLRGVDAVAFIASSERDELDHNTESWQNFLENLEANSLKIDEVPTVIQFNKQDLPNALTPAEIEAVHRFSGIPTFPAAAIRAEGSSETLQGLMSLLWKQLCENQNLDERLGITTEEFQSHVKKVFSGSEREYGRAGN